MKRLNKRKKRRMNPNTVLIIRQVLIGVMIFSFLGLLILSIWYSTRIEVLTLTEVEVSGGETISHEEVKKIVWSKLNGTYLGLVPRVFALTYPEEDIVASLGEIDRIKDIKVHRDGGEALLVTFDEYTPEALWCSNGESPHCVFLDENGYAFSASPKLSGGAFVRFGKIGEEPEVGQSVLLLEDYKTATKLVQLLENAGWYVSQADVDRADDVYMQIVDGGELKASLKQDPTETVNNLLVVLGSDDFAHIAPGNFKYIDLRFGNKVFVNEVLVSESDETEETPFEIESVQVEEPETEVPEPVILTTITAESDVASSTEAE